MKGDSGNDGGIFLDDPQALHTAGPDGLVNTSDDDGAVETITFPGKDQTLGTADDQIVSLTQYKREIRIRDVANESGQLRSITVLITYQNGPTKRTYTLVTYISAYS